MKNVSASPNIDAMWENCHPLSGAQAGDFPMHYIACAIMEASRDVCAQLANIADRIDAAVEEQGRWMR